MKKKIIQRYINNFRRRLSPSLRADIGLACHIYPAEAGGAIIVFLLGAEQKNADEYKPSSRTLGTALKNVEQHAFGGDTSNFTFSGTNTLLEPNKIIFIKDDNYREWTDRAALNDVDAVLSSHQKRRS